MDGRLLLGSGCKRAIMAYRAGVDTVSSGQLGACNDTHLPEDTVRVVDMFVF